MSYYNSSRSKGSKQKTAIRSPLLRRILFHLGRQGLAAGLCFLLVFGMNQADNPRLKGYASALGNALRYESNLTALQEKGSAFFHQLFPKNPSFKSLPEPDANTVTEH